MHAAAAGVAVYRSVLVMQVQAGAAAQPLLLPCACPLPGSSCWCPVPRWWCCARRPCLGCQARRTGACSARIETGAMTAHAHDHRCQQRACSPARCMAVPLASRQKLRHAFAAVSPMRLLALSPLAAAATTDWPRCAEPLRRVHGKQVGWPLSIIVAAQARWRAFSDRVAPGKELKAPHVSHPRPPWHTPHCTPFPK